MAAVAQSMGVRVASAPDYPMLGSDVDAEGEEDAEAGLEDDAQLSEAVAQAQKSDEDTEVESEEDEESGSEAASDVGKGIVKATGTRARDSGKDAMLDDGSEAEATSAEDDDESEKSSSGEESAAPPEWEVGTDGGEDGSIEVANRNNCM